MRRGEEPLWHICGTQSPKSTGRGVNEPVGTTHDFVDRGLAERALIARLIRRSSVRARRGPPHVSAVQAPFSHQRLGPTRCRSSRGRCATNVPHGPVEAPDRPARAGLTSANLSSRPSSRYLMRCESGASAPCGLPFSRAVLMLGVLMQPTRRSRGGPSCLSMTVDSSSGSICTVGDR